MRKLLASIRWFLPGLRRRHIYWGLGNLSVGPLLALEGHRVLAEVVSKPARMEEKIKRTGLLFACADDLRRTPAGAKVNGFPEPMADLRPPRCQFARIPKFGVMGCGRAG